ncbi:MAG: MMPL family transporter, partial [Planctomycetota bacterium]
LSHFFVQFAPEEIPALIKKLQPKAIQQKIAQNMKKLYSADPAFATRINIDPLGLIEDFYRHLPAQQSSFDLESGYIFSPNQKALLIKMKGKFPATQIDQSIALVAEVEKAIDIAKREHPEIQVEISGGYSTAVASYYEFRRDLTVTLFTSIICVIFLICFVFREWRLIYLAGIPLHLAILWTFALGSFFLGSLTSIALSFAAILAGLGVDFAIHFYNRFRIELMQHDLETAIERTLTLTFNSLFTAGITTSCGFLVFYRTDFRGFSELGLLSGTGILICLFFMLLCFP